MKTCRSCGETKEFINFYKNKSSEDGYTYKCRKCLYQPKLPSRIKSYLEARAKPCSVCKITKPFEEFFKDESTKLKLSYCCKACIAQDKFDRLNPGAKLAVKERVWRREKLSQGLCTTCGQAPIDYTNKRSSVRCLDCKIKRAESAKARTNLWIRKGLCKGCGAERDSQHKHCLVCRSRDTEKKQAKRQKLKLKVYELYGNACACCGESNQYFLTLDHINRDGHEERRKGVKQTQLLKSLLQLKREDIQLLCYNCNCGRERTDGICPHKLEMGS